MVYIFADEDFFSLISFVAQTTEFWIILWCISVRFSNICKK